MNKKITLNDYYDLAEHGARILFDIDNYRLLDGDKDEKLNCFLIVYGETKSEDVFYLIDLETCYELFTLWHFEPPKERHRYLLERIAEIINTIVKEEL